MGKADPDVRRPRARERVATRRSFASSTDETIVTDGPFADTKEVLGGVFVTELPDLDEAIRLAALVPAAEYGTLEIRPLDHPVSDGRAWGLAATANPGMIVAASPTRCLL